MAHVGAVGRVAAVARILSTMKLSGPSPGKYQIPSKNARPSQHDLLRFMIAEHAALMNETCHLIREVRDLVLDISALIDAEDGGATQ